MTGYDVTRQALILLGYTDPTGEIDSRQNGEQLRRALPVLGTVLADIRHLQGLAPVQVESLADPLPVSDDIALRVLVPGVAMYLAQGENDGDSYNRFSQEYLQKRSGVPREARRVLDVQPRVRL